MIDIIIPTIGRADRLAALVENIDAATIGEYRVWFVTEAHDEATIAAVHALGLESIINARTENYAGAVNTAYDATDGDYLFCGADDLVFHHGWDADALRRQTHDDWFAVFGTNDLLNPYVMAGAHSTHSLVARWYLDEIGGVVDLGPGSFLPECYDHNFTDTEFIGTAKMRARFVPCLDSVVEHMHVSKTGVVDDTHMRSVRDFHADDALYESRRDLWFGISR
jgi:glycosyltransferase involved in cell wall biosynthesis